MLVDALLDACLDTLRMFPFLFLAYLFMEWLEHGTGKRFEAAIARGGRVGPLVGSLLGVVPQCGFAGVAATLYAARVITPGTLIAVFLVTSDEMLPVMLSQPVDPLLVVEILSIKVAVGVVCGLVIDALMARLGRLHTGFASRRRHEGHVGHDIHELCEEEGCSCEEEGEEDGGDVSEAGHEGHGHGRSHGGSILLPALRHSVNVSLFILVITLVINLLVESGFEEMLAGVTAAPYASAVVTGVLGLIPNCAVSVGVTQLYLDGLVSGSAMMAALTVNSGVGLLVLFRTNHDADENVRIMLVMLALGVATGFLVEALGLL